MIIFILALLLLASCTSHPPDDDEIIWQHNLPVAPKEEAGPSLQTTRAHIVYLIQSEKSQEAITELLETKKSEPYLFHEESLQTLGLALLTQGIQSPDPEDTITSLYGAGISHDEKALPIAEAALGRENPQIQLLAVAVIASFDTEEATSLLEQAMKSNFIFVRMEAAYWLAKRHAKDAYGQLTALMAKLDPKLHELFPHLFAMEASAHSTSELKRLLFDQNEAVRREAILAAADSQRDDFLSDISLLAKEPSYMQQEACAYALGALGDEGARKQLVQLSHSNSPTTCLAANYALLQLGDIGAQIPIVEMAARGDLFAIRLLGSIDTDGELLVELLDHEDRQVRANAAMALLQRRDRRCLDGLLDILIDSHKDYTYQPISSLGGSLTAWKVTPSSSQQLVDEPHFFELSLRLREEALIQALELTEEDFLAISRTIFLTGQFDLVPLTVRLLENLKSEGAIALLKEHARHIGMPLIRGWCSLALYRLHVEGPYAEEIRKWVEKHEDTEVFQARPILPWKQRPQESKHQLTLAQSCALLIESYEALACRQDEKGIEVLLRAIRDGNEHNRYTLAGLLMRASL